MGEQDIVGHILSVLGRPTKNGKTIYDIAFSDSNTYTTFNGGIAEKANALVGQPVSARVKVEQKGQYENYYLNDVAPQGQLPLSAAPVQQGTPISGIPMVPVGIGSVLRDAQAPTATIPMQDNSAKDAAIAKAVAVKAASEIVAALFQGAGPEAAKQALECFDEIGAHVLSVLTDAQKAAPQTPEAVAAAVNVAAGQEVVQTGTVIPWS